MQASALLQTIINHPDADEPRLAYADWLEAEGDRERARFIRVQCTLARGAADPGEMAELQQQETALLGQYGYLWAESFGEQIHEWRYHRGFIENVQMRLEAPAEAIREVFSQTPVRYVRDISQLDDLSGVVDALPLFTNLLGLEFWYLYAFDDQLLARLLAAPELAQLRTLILHHDRNGNLANERVLINALQSPLRRNLRQLAVNVDSQWRGPSPRIVHAIARSPYLTNLQTLNLSNTRLGVATVAALKRSTTLASMVDLDLRSCALTEAAWDAVLKLPQLSRLHRLWLHDTRIIDMRGLRTADLRDIPRFKDAFDASGATVDWETSILTWNMQKTWSGLSWQARRTDPLF